MRRKHATRTLNAYNSRQPSSTGLACRRLFTPPKKDVVATSRGIRIAHWCCWIVRTEFMRWQSERMAYRRASRHPHCAPAHDCPHFELPGCPLPRQPDCFILMPTVPGQLAGLTGKDQELSGPVSAEFFPMPSISLSGRSLR